MSNFLLVNVDEIMPIDVDQNDDDLISIKELSFMHYSALGEVLKGNPSGLNKKLYKATKEHVDKYVSELVESKK